MVDPLAAIEADIQTLKFQVAALQADDKAAKININTLAGALANIKILQAQVLALQAAVAALQPPKPPALPVVFRQPLFANPIRKSAMPIALLGAGPTFSSLVPPVTDPIAQLLATMQPGQWRELTVPGSSWGGIASIQQPLTLTEWDPGGEGAPITWINDAAVATVGGVSPAPHGVMDFSCPTVRADGMVIHNGGGHTSGGDNSVAQFSSKTACTNILASGGSTRGSWSRLIDGGFYIPQANVQPVWSAQVGSGNNAAHTTGTYGASASSITVASILTNGGSISAAAGWTVGGPDIPPFVTIASITGTGPYTIGLTGGVTLNAGTNQPIGFSTASFWATTNKHSQQRLAVGHTYAYNIALGTTGYWALAGIGGWDPNFLSPPGPKAEIIKDDGTTALTASMATNAAGYGIQGIPLWCDLDSNVYCWGGSSTDATLNHLWKITNPTNAGLAAAADLGRKGPDFGTGQTTSYAPVMCQFPVATPGTDPGKRAIFSWRSSGGFSGGNTNYVVLQDILGTPNGAQYNFGSVPSFSSGGGYLGGCFDTKRAQVVVFNGLGNLAFVTLDQSFPQSNPANSAFVIETGGSGQAESPTLNGALGTDAFCRIEYLPVQDAYVAGVAGHVYLRKPVSTAVGTGTSGTNTLALTSIVGGIAIGQAVSLSGPAEPTVLPPGTTVTGISGSLTITISTTLGADLAAPLVFNF